MTSDALRRLDALAQVGLRLARSSPSGRVLLAQLAIGLDPALVPRPWGDELLAEMRSAQEAAIEPLSTKRVEQILRAAWGVRPSQELDDLSPEPVAVTPTSQVHHGELDGSPVAVKVLRPGLSRSFRQDLALLDSLVAPLGAAFPGLDARGVLREVAERVRDECDLEHEAANARRFHRLLRGHARLMVPEPVMRLAAEEVLVREWVDGTALAAVDAPDGPAAALVEFVLGGCPAGIMNAGLTGEDVFVLRDGRVAVIDFGTCCVVDRARLAGALEALQALRADDGERLADTLADLGWLARKDAPEALALMRELCGELLGSEAVRLDAKVVGDAGRRLAPRRERALALVRSGSLAPPDVWPARGVAQLFATIARVGATGEWSRLALSALSDGWEGEMSHRDRCRSGDRTVQDGDRSASTSPLRSSQSGCSSRQTRR
jgi:predicted unusual protein kinase regulating ubiquinone biosynthesis (AarF/ABC1/UbiB family)